MSERQQTHWDDCYKDRNHTQCAITRIEQLQARLDAAAALIPLFHERGRDMNQHSAARATFHVCADKLEAALSPTDPPAGEGK